MTFETNRNHCYQVWHKGSSGRLAEDFETLEDAIKGAYEANQREVELGYNPSSFCIFSLDSEVTTCDRDDDHFIMKRVFTESLVMTTEELKMHLALLELKG